MDDRIIPFGKHKGKPIEILASDKQYTDWLIAQSWFKEKYINIYNVVINNFREPVDTPEHNKIQVKFLKLEYRLKLAYLLNKNFFDITSEKINKGIKQVLNELSGKNKENFIYAMSNPDIRDEFGLYTRELLHYSTPIFENVDVSFSISYGLFISYDNNDSSYSRTIFGRKNRSRFWIEIKPTVSDDFPSILRQMKASMPIKYGGSGERYYILLVGEYSGIGATKEEFIEFFNSQGYYVIFENQIENIDLPEYEIELKLDPDLEKLIENNTVANKGS